jgi:glycosyltransferase involved in cell wall biosynthesis
MVPDARVLITKFPYYSRLAGPEMHTLKLVESLQKEGVDFHLMSSDPALIAEFNKNGWGVTQWWLGYSPVNRVSKILFFLLWPFYWVSGLIGVIYCMKKFKVNKMYCLTLGDKLILTSIGKLLGMKVVWSEQLSLDPVILKSIYRVFYKFWSKFCQKVVVSSVFLACQLAEIKITKNVQVIYSGVEMKNYKQSDMFEIMANKRFSFGSSGDVYRIGCVSRLEKMRGLEYLIKAMNFLKDEYHDVDLVIVGEGSQRKRLQWLIDHYELSDSVKLVGYQEKFVDWIYDFDVFVLPSLEEAFGHVVIEALACVKPVVVSRVGGLMEIVEDGKTGLFVEPKNSRAIAGAIYSIKNDKKLAKDLAENGREVVLRKYGMEKMVREYRKLFLG